MVQVFLPPGIDSHSCFLNMLFLRKPQFRLFLYNASLMTSIHKEFPALKLVTILRGLACAPQGMKCVFSLCLCSLLPVLSSPF